MRGTVPGRVNIAKKKQSMAIAKKKLKRVVKTMTVVKEPKSKYSGSTKPLVEVSVRYCGRIHENKTTAYSKLNNKNTRSGGMGIMVKRG